MKERGDAAHSCEPAGSRVLWFGARREHFSGHAQARQRDVPSPEECLRGRPKDAPVRANAVRDVPQLTLAAFGGDELRGDVGRIRELARCHVARAVCLSAAAARTPSIGDG